MSAFWNGKIALAEADGKPGRYYVTARKETGETAYLLGPFVQPTYGQAGHARALGSVQKARRYVVDNYSNGCWWTYGTTRLPLYGRAPEGKLNALLS